MYATGMTAVLVSTIMWHSLRWTCTGMYRNEDIYEFLRGRDRGPGHLPGASLLVWAGLVERDRTEKLLEKCCFLVSVVFFVFVFLSVLALFCSFFFDCRALFLCRKSGVLYLCVKAYLERGLKAKMGFGTRRFLLRVFLGIAI